MSILGEDRKMLEVQNLTVGYGHLEVLHDLTISVSRDKPVAVLGANGAGKTTLCHALSGVVPIKAGTVQFNAQDVTLLGSAARVKNGIVQVPEGRQVFSRMTVLENLRLGAFVHSEPDASALGEIYEMFPILEERASQYAGLLSGGEQQMLALARALLSRPKLLILDEPSQGLAPIAVEQVGNAVRAINERGVAILLVEQNLALAEMVADYGFILETGRCVREGPANETLSAETLAQSYLGH